MTGERLLLDLDAFFLEHRSCGDLDAYVSDTRVWVARALCGADRAAGGRAAAP